MMATTATDPRRAENILVRPANQASAADAEAGFREVSSPSARRVVMRVDFPG